MLALSFWANLTFSQQNVDTIKALPAIENEVLKLNAEYSKALLKADTATIKHILAEDYLYINADGALKNKVQTIELYKASNFKFLSGQEDEVRIRVYNEVAVVTGRFIFKGESNGEIINGMARYTSVFVKRGEHWQMVSEQTTNVVNH